MQSYLFRPRGESDRVVAIDDDVRERQGERRRAANHLALRVVLGTVARALELVFSLVPRHDATEVRAHGVQAEVGQGAIRLDDEVRRITLQALREGVVAREVRLQPSGALDVVAVRILGRLTSSTTASAAKRGPSVSWIMISWTLTLAIARSGDIRRVVRFATRSVGHRSRTHLGGTKKYA